MEVACRGCAQTRAAGHGMHPDPALLPSWGGDSPRGVGRGAGSGLGEQAGPAAALLWLLCSSGGNCGGETVEGAA